MKKIVTKLFIKIKLCNIKKNPTYVAGEINSEYIFKISNRSVKICSSYVFGQLKKSGFEKNKFKVLNTVKFWAFRHFSALNL